MKISFRVWVLSKPLPFNRLERDKLLDSLDSEMFSKGSPAAVLNILSSLPYGVMFTTSDLAFRLNLGKTWVQTTLDFLVTKGLIRPAEKIVHWDVIPKRDLVAMGVTAIDGKPLNREKEAQK